MHILSYLATERVSIVAATSASNTASDAEKIVRLVSPVALFFDTSGDASEDTSAYLPADTEVILYLQANQTVSFILPTGEADNHVWVTEVRPVSL